MLSWGLCKFGFVSMNLVFIANPFNANHKLITITIKAKLLPSSAQLQLQLASARSAGLRWSLLSIFIPPTRVRRFQARLSLYLVWYEFWLKLMHLHTCFQQVLASLDGLISSCYHFISNQSWWGKNFIINSTLKDPFLTQQVLSLAQLSSLCILYFSYKTF